MSLTDLRFLHRRYASLDTKYHLYPVHVSMSFLFSSTLASTLYLLLLRFLSRQYEDAFRLASTIGTDTQLSAEEEQAFKALGRSNSDCHPDAHACRLKISLVTMDAPVVCPWDLTVQASRYVSKLSHISAVCRLELHEELSLLEECVCDSSDPRFYNEEGKPRYSLYEVTLVKNRKHYLRALLQGQGSAEVWTVPRAQSSRWPVARNLAALMMDESSFYSIEVSYSSPAQMSGHAVLDVAHKFWSGAEEHFGRAYHLGFLFLYEMLTGHNSASARFHAYSDENRTCRISGTKPAKILSTDNSASMAVMLFEMMSDKTQPSLLASIISVMARFPHIRPLMPKYKDTRKFKHAVVKALGDDHDPISPLGELLRGCLLVIRQEFMALMSPVPDWQAVPHAPATRRSVEKEQPGSRAWIIPGISNFSCQERVLSPVAEEEFIADAVAGTLDSIFVSKP